MCSMTEIATTAFSEAICLHCRHIASVLSMEALEIHEELNERSEFTMREIVHIIRRIISLLRMRESEANILSMLYSRDDGASFPQHMP